MCTAIKHIQSTVRSTEDALHHKDVVEWQWDPSEDMFQFPLSHWKKEFYQKYITSYYTCKVL